MENYDFNKYIDRKNSDCVKYDALKQFYGRDDLIPLWVADMDFETPDFIIDAIKKRLEHPILGYLSIQDGYYQSIIDWCAKIHNWDIKKEWISYIPGIVKGVGLVLQAFTKPGDKVIIQPPVYHPFRIVPELNKREIVWNNLIFENGEYKMDFKQLESIITPDCKVLILCNPHNPAGIVWDKETLIQLAKICKKHNILVISDEIHSEMVHKGFKHTSFATSCKEAAENSVTFMAPSKTFNIPGIVSSYSIVPSDTIREKFYSFLEANEFGDSTIFAVTATIAAYEKGEAWRTQMMEYVEENISFVNDYISNNIKEIKCFIPQASYLMWLDCRGLNLNHDELIDLFVDKAHLALNDGTMFGPGGEDFMRMNLGAPRVILEKALKQLKDAVSGL
ncbi:MAG: PatB family C-S lyase [Bacteroidales bacterium]|nr:PatB family C-S lyase [Bacteroidales bacterium]